MAIILSVLPIGIPGRTEARASTASLMTCRRAQRQRRWHRRLLHPISPPRQLWRPSREGGIRGVVGVGIGYRRTWRRRIHPNVLAGRDCHLQGRRDKPVTQSTMCRGARGAFEGSVLERVCAVRHGHVLHSICRDADGRHGHRPLPRPAQARRWRENDSSTSPPVLGYPMRNFNDHPQSSSSLSRWLGPMLGLFLARPGNAP